ncbi:MFS transporter, partial [Acinetobacter pittii]
GIRSTTYPSYALNLAQLGALCLSNLCATKPVTSIRWMLVAVFSHYFIGQLFAQCLHAFSFGLFHLIAMRVIFQNFSAGQQGRGQALYSTMWGLGVAFGSVLAGHFWKTLSGELIFMCASVVVLLGLCFVKWLPKQVDSSTT